MLCIVIHGPSIEDARRQISEAMKYGNLVEWRLDCFQSLELKKLQHMRSLFPIPTIFTLRSRSQGGNYAGSEQHRFADLQRLMTLKPEYIDLEHDVPDCIAKEMIQESGSQLILSYHNFTKTPNDLDLIYQTMQKTPAALYKIAVTPHNCLDALRLACWAKTKGCGKLIAISMGSHGQLSRILAPVIGCPITYAALDKGHPSAPGQLCAQTLIERYRHPALNPATEIYGLIGDPVEQSIGDEMHNRNMAAHGLDAVYVKLQVTPPELPEFLKYAKELPLRGLSVTMPLKEHIVAYLDQIAPEALAIGAVNTLVFEKGNILGYNTDGIGALNAIESFCQVQDKKVVVIGAGGAAKAIAYEASKRGASVVIVNRNAERAHDAARQLHCRGIGLDQMESCAKEGYDILINSTPSPMPISPEHILPGTLTMDIKTRPKMTPFLEYALQKNCMIVYGHQMFLEQAAGQFALWFH